MKEHLGFAEQMVSHHSVESNQASDVVEHLKSHATFGVDPSIVGEWTDEAAIRAVNSSGNYSFKLEDAHIHGIEGAIVLNHIRYRIAENVVNKYRPIDGMYWVRISQDNLTRWLPFLTKKRLVSILKRLNLGGFIRSKKLGIVDNSTNWHTIPSEFSSAGGSDANQSRWRSIDKTDAELFGVDAAFLKKQIDLWLESSDYQRIEKGLRWVMISHRKLAEMFPFLSERRIREQLKIIKGSDEYFVCKLDRKRMNTKDWITSRSEVNLKIDDIHAEALDINYRFDSVHGGRFAKYAALAQQCDSSSEKAATRALACKFVLAEYLNPDDYRCSIAAYEVISRMKDSGYPVYDGPLTMGEWDVVESRVNVVSDDLEGFMIGFVEHANLGKLVSLSNMFDVEFDGVPDFEAFVDKIAYRWMN